MLAREMQHLKQPIARRANEEDGCKGHFFEQRFYSGALLSEEAVLAAMAYVDLNPVRAKLARRLAQCQHASITARLLENSPAALADFLRPLASGLARGGRAVLPARAVSDRDFLPNSPGPASNAPASHFPARAAPGPGAPSPAAHVRIAPRTPREISATPCDQKLVCPSPSSPS